MTRLCVVCHCYVYCLSVERSVHFFLAHLVLPTNFLNLELLNKRIFEDFGIYFISVPKMVFDKVRKREFLSVRDNSYQFT